MKTSVLRDALKESLSVMERITPKSTSLPILNNILLSAAKNFLEIAATDLEIGIRYKILAKNEKEGKLAIPAKPLFRFISLLPQTYISLQSKDQNLQVDTEEYHTTLKAIDPEEFPIIPSLKENEIFTEVENQVFCRGISQVMNFAGQTSVRPELSGVFFAFQKKIVKIAATDSFRLAEKTLFFEKDNAFESSFILPAKTAREVVAILGEKNGKTKIYLSPNQIIFDYTQEDQPFQTSVQIVSRLIEGEYPQYQDVIPKSPKTKIIVSREEFLHHLEVASIFAGKMNEVHLFVDPTKKGVEITSRNIDVGEHKSFFGAKIEGEKIELDFNWRFLTEGFLPISSREVSFGLTSEEGPALITSTDQKDFLYVVMPIRA